MTSNALNNILSPLSLTGSSLAPTPVAIVTGTVTIQERILGASFYALSSTAIMFVNKFVLSSYSFPSPTFLSICQSIATVIIMITLRKCDIIDFPSYEHKVVKQVFPLPLLFLANAITGLGGTKGVSIPMFACLRRFTMLMTMILEYLILNSTASNSTLISLVLMMGGALLAALNDLSFNFYGYSNILANDLFTAAQGVVTKKKLDSKGLGTFGLMFYNSIFSLPFAFIVWYLTEDMSAVSQFKHWNDVSFVLLFLTSSCLGIVLQYSLFYCTKVNSALTTNVVGSCKNIFSTYVGMMVSPDYIFSLTNFLGINISVVGSLVYAYEEYQNALKKGSLNLDRNQLNQHHAHRSKFDKKKSEVFEDEIEDGIHEGNDDEEITLMIEEDMQHEPMKRHSISTNLGQHA